MLFCISLLNFVHIGALIAEIWRQYLFIKMAATTDKYYFRIRICWCHCLQMVKVYQETKFHRHISIYGSDITTSVFEKQTSAILEFYFRFWSRPLRRNRRVLCISLPNFVQILAPIAKIWRHIHFSRWRPQPLNATSGFVFVNVTAFRRSKFIRKPNFVDISQFTAEKKQTSAILEFYFRFWSRLFRRNRRVFLHQATEFRPNRSTHSENMTSYPFLKMAATIAKYYFRFRICWCRCIRKDKVYQETKFRRHNSIYD